MYINSSPSLIVPLGFTQKNGRTNSDNSNRAGSTNLLDDHYDEFSEFIAKVLFHFDSIGVPFSQISPINEPQFSWNSGQEGCPWKNDEVKVLIHELNAQLVAKKLDTKILLSEAASYKYLHQSYETDNKSDIIWRYFDKEQSGYLGDYSNMLPGIGAHSYWTNGSDSLIRYNREEVAREAKEQGNLELYQTEYNLLDIHFSDKFDNALFLAKIIYADLEIAGVSMWDYWTAVERERWSQLNRFFLIRLRPSGGNYASLENSGTIEVDKNLWAMANFSKFIRPGYKRINTQGADDLSGLMATSFIAPDQSEIISVYVNYTDSLISTTHNFTNLPSGKIIDKSKCLKLV